MEERKFNYVSLTEIIQCRTLRTGFRLTNSKRFVRKRSWLNRTLRETPRSATRGCAVCNTTGEQSITENKSQGLHLDLPFSVRKQIQPLFHNFWTWNKTRQRCSKLRKMFLNVKQFTSSRQINMLLIIIFFFKVFHFKAGFHLENYVFVFTTVLTKRFESAVTSTHCKTKWTAGLLMRIP